MAIFHNDFPYDKVSMKLNASLIIPNQRHKEYLDSQLVSYIAGPSEKGAYGFYDILQANDVDDVIHVYDVTVGNVKHASQTF